MSPITFPESLITEETFERQGWEKIQEDESEGPGGYYWILPLPKDNPDSDSKVLISNCDDEFSELGLPKGQYYVEIDETNGLGFCSSEEQIEILYRALTGQELYED